MIKYIYSMGNAVKTFAKIVAKGAIKAGLGVIPVVGGPLGDYVTSKFAVGIAEINPSLLKPHKVVKREIRNVKQLLALMKEYPEAAQEAGLTRDEVLEKYQEAMDEKAGKEKAAGKGKKKKDADDAAEEKSASASSSSSSMAIGGRVRIYKPHPLERQIKDKINLEKMAVGGKVKKQRSAAQIAATKKLVEMNRKRRGGK